MGSELDFPIQFLFPYLFCDGMVGKDNIILERDMIIPKERCYEYIGMEPAGHANDSSINV